MKTSKIGRLGSAICVMVCFASPHTSEGTSIVVYQRADQLVVAADSREIKNGVAPNDNSCKILSTPNGIVVGVVGLANKGKIDFTVEGANIAGSLAFTNQDDLDAIATKWAKFVRDIYTTKI